MADVTKRVNYFDRQFLRALEFEDEQAYHLDRRRRHNRFLHTPGVADGLTVSGNPGDTAVKVEAGTAIDSDGSEIVLAAGANQPAPAAPAVKAELYIVYAEQTTHPSDDPGVQGTKTRITEKPVLVTRRTDPNPEAIPAGGILLAELSLANGALTSSPSDRRTRAGSTISEDLTVGHLFLKNAGFPQAQWPILSCSAPNQAALQNSSLRIEDQREVLFQNAGQIRAFDDNHRIVFDPPHNELALHELGDIRFLTGGPSPSERLRILASGNVGIGTPNPSSLLEIRGSGGFGKGILLTSSGGNSPNLQLAPGVDTPDAGMLGFGDGTGWKFHIARSSDQGATKYLTIQDNGNVGIGTPAPHRILSLQGRDPAISMADTDDPAGSRWEIQANAFVADNFGFVRYENGNAQAARSVVVNSAGNVCIGAQTPENADGWERVLDLASTNHVKLSLRTAAIDGRVLAHNGGWWNAPAGMVIGTRSKHPLSFATNAASRMVIETSGEVGIGIASPSRILHAHGSEIHSGGPAGGFSFANRDTQNFVEAPGAGERWVWYARNGQAALWSGGDKVAVDIRGNIRATGFNPPSDERLKTNIVPLSNVLPSIEKIRGLRFEWKENEASLGGSPGQKAIGVIAQEIEMVFPELVTTWQEDGYKAVDYDRLTAVLLEGIKELNGQILALQRRLETLEAASA